MKILNAVFQGLPPRDTDRDKQNYYNSQYKKTGQNKKMEKESYTRRFQKYKEYTTYLQYADFSFGLHLNTVLLTC